MQTPAVLLAICALVGLAVVALVTLVLVPHDSDSTPVITTIIGLVTPTVVALLALLKIEGVEEKVDDVHKAVNGVKDETHAIAEATTNG